MSKKFPRSAALFHMENKNDEQVISESLIKQAQRSGKLNLSDKRLVQWPDEILKLGIVYSFNNEIDMDGKSDNENCKWWELEPLKYLDLSCNSLKKIPKQISQLDSLTVLLLQQNMIETLPSEFGLLKNLVKLDLGYNKLDSLPHELSDLKELRSLNLTNNALNAFPESIYDLIMLNHIDISSNILEEMKPGIGFLTRLVSLNLSKNKLSNIPNDIVDCKALKELNLSFNKITSSGLPDLTFMLNLETIQLQYNLLTTLPKIQGCSNLKELHLNFNQIEEITVEELSTLTHLQVLNLRNNYLQKLPKELSCLQNLVRLDLSNNNLKELPPTLSLLPHLKNLYVEGNSLRTIRRDLIQSGTQRLLNHLKQLLPLEEADKNYNAPFPCTASQDLPDRFSMRCSRSVSLSSRGLCNVVDTVFEEAVAVPCTMVDLSKNNLHQVPSGLWLLCKTLNDLNLSQNYLVEIPGEIKQCENLRYLNVSNNKLKSLPEEFSSCSKIKELNISFNCLEQIPNCVYSFTALEILFLSNNKITNIEAEKLIGLKYLTHLDLTNNDLKCVPPLIGNMTQLRTLGLEGNGLRTLKQATIAKGTEAVLAWLRNKIV